MKGIWGMYLAMSFMSLELFAENDPLLTPIPEMNAEFVEKGGENIGHNGSLKEGSLHPAASSPTPEIKREILKAGEKELLDFESIKGILQKDNLEKEAQIKLEKSQQAELKKLERTKKRFDIPGDNEIWEFLSEWWLTKNASILKWDFEHADLGINLYLNDVLKTLGIYQRRFKILLLNNPTLAHGILPSKEGEHIVLLSLPFIQTMDLTKQEISMLILENYFRDESGLIKKRLKTSELSEILGGNFYEKKSPKEIVEKVLQNYDQLFFHKGFSFQEQFEITQKMNLILKSHPVYWNAYLNLLRKINDLVKGNLLYQDYSKIYPSPEMQRRWILPTK